MDYNAASTGGSNYGPSNPDHLKLARERLEAVVAREGGESPAVPSELVKASGGSLDPHLPPNAVDLQVTRGARAHKADPDQVRELVRTHTDQLKYWDWVSRLLEWPKLQATCSPRE